MSIQTFQADLDRFAKILRIRSEQALRLVALELWKSIISRTPVDTGRARSGWQLSIGFASDYVPPVGTDRVNTPDVGKLKLGQAVYIVNNVEYIVYLEEGSSQQAPAGMVRISVAELEAKIEHLIANAS